MVVATRFRQEVPYLAMVTSHVRYVKGKRVGKLSSYGQDFNTLTILWRLHDLPKRMDTFRATTQVDVCKLSCHMTALLRHIR